MLTKSAEILTGNLRELYYILHAHNMPPSPLYLRGRPACENFKWCATNTYCYMQLYCQTPASYLYIKKNKLVSQSLGICYSSTFVLCTVALCQCSSIPSLRTNKEVPRVLVTIQNEIRNPPQSKRMQFPGSVQFYSQERKLTEASFDLYRKVL